MAEITNNVTGGVIDQSKVASTKSGGVLITGNDVGSFTYVPGREITYTPAKTTISVAGPQKQLSYGSKADTIDNENQEIVKRTVYDFGIDSITARYTSPKPISGFVSQPIDIGACSYITLSVKTAGALDGRTEFSIIDSSAEVPILPEEMGQEIQNEKLFPNIQTRFSIDTDKKYIIYKDGMATSFTYEQIRTMPLDDGEYSISYTSKGEYKYFPIGDKIRLKVIARCGSSKPEPIKAMTIKRFGGEMPWRISD